jgi:integrase
MANAPLVVSNAVEKAIEASAPTIGELCQQYINEKEAGQYAEKTKQTTRLYFSPDTGYIFKGTRGYPKPLASAEDSILSVDRGMLINWMNVVWADVSEKSKETYTTNLASFFNWVETTQNIKGYINPASSLRPKTGKAATVTVFKESKRWTDEELTTILKATTDNDEGSWLIRIMAYTGLRIDETAQLLKKDITLRKCASDGSRYFAVSVDISEEDKDYKKLKTNAAKRNVYLGFPDDKIDAFLAWMDKQDDGRVFSKLVRDKVSGYTNSAGRHTKEIYLALKKQLTPKSRPNHAFRHAFNDRCYKAKMPLRMEKRVLGHSLGKDMTVGVYAEDHEHDEIYMTLRDCGVWRNLL